MAAFFVWNSSYDTGIASIDAQHKKLVAILNNLYEAMSKGQANQVLGKLLAELVDYTIVHFAHEERLFKQHGYVEASAHKMEHDALTAQVKKLQGDFASGRISLSMEVGTFLKDWLKNHILKTDKKYVAFLVSKGVK
jgi:hemerythrin-like metal-binding protein